MRLATIVFILLFFVLVTELIFIRLAPLPLGFMSGTETPSGNTTVLNTAPVEVNLTSPEDGEETTSTPKFQWSDSEDVNGQNVTFYLIIDDDSDFSSVTRNITSLATTTYQLTSSESLSAGTYYWRVDAYDGIDYNQSVFRNFTATVTEAPGPPSGGGGRPKEYNFTVDPQEISMEVYFNSSDIMVMYVKNLEDEADFRIKHNLEEFLNVSRKKFTLKKGAMETLFVTVNGFETGVYTGELTVKGESMKKIIPVLIEVETRDKYFDAFLEVPEWSRRIHPGDDVFVKVNILALYDGEYTVNNTYGVKDNQGRLVSSSEETMKVQGNVSFVRNLELPVLNPKDYTAFVEVKYMDTTATSTDLFKVVPIEPVDYLMPAMFILLIIGVLIVFGRVIKLSRQKDLKYGKIKSIIKKKQLQAKLQALERARKAGVVSKKTYKRTKNKIKSEIRKC